MTMLKLMHTNYGRWYGRTCRTTVTLDSSGGITLDADGGTITFSDGGVSLGTITSSGYSGTAQLLLQLQLQTMKAQMKIMRLSLRGGDVDGGNLGLESDGDLTYNPSTGRITATELLHYKLQHKLILHQLEL